MKEPVNIKGVVAFPNEDGDRYIRFIDANYNDLFRIADGDSIVVRNPDGSCTPKQCEYIDDCHAEIGGSVFHICQFAELMMQRGATYAPLHPKGGDIFDTYDIYQIEDVGRVPYSFMNYESAKGNLKRADYRKVYSYMLPKRLTLDDLYVRHNADSRPFPTQMRSMSVSDVIVLNRSGKRDAYYVDSIGFQKVDEFLRQPQKKRNKGEER